MTCRRYQKLTQYLHVSDRANEPAQNSADYDKLYKIHPVLNIVQDSFTALPAKTIKRGIKVRMLCDADAAYVHQFEVYLG